MEDTNTASPRIEYEDLGKFFVPPALRWERRLQTNSLPASRRKPNC